MRKLVLLLVVVFLGFWLFTDPSGLADATSNAGGALADGADALFSAVIDFIGEL